MINLSIQNSIPLLGRAHRKGLAVVASFYSGHLNPSCTGSNFQDRAHCCSLLGEGTPRGKARSRWPTGPCRAPHGQISFRGHGWPTSESRYAGEVCGAGGGTHQPSQGFLCTYRNHSAPRWQSTLPLLKTLPGQSATRLVLKIHP